jgi:hypothetical protein
MPVPTNLSNLAGASVEGQARDKQREELNSWRRWDYYIQ